MPTITPFRRGLRPVQPESFPRYVEQELDKVGLTVGQLREAAESGASGGAGADGASAYEVAVANGFVGTETEWLESLEGADGAQGPIGPQGPEGPAGADGAPYAAKGCLLRRSTNYSVAHATTTTIYWNDEVADVGDWFDPGVSTGYMTVPAGVSYVSISACLQFANQTDQAIVNIDVYDGSSWNTVARGDSDTAGGDYAMANIAFLPVSPGDLIRATAYVSGARNVEAGTATHLSVAAIG